MIKDPIVEEVLQAREKLWEKCGGDFDKWVQYLRACEKKHPERLVTKEEVLKHTAHKHATA